MAGPTEAAPPPGYFPNQGIPVISVSGPPQPQPGISVKPPLVPPQPGMVIVAYELGKPETGCCKCDGMKAVGWILIILAALLFPPVACFVCCVPSFFEEFQRPVYGYPTAQPGMPIGGPSPLPPKF